MTDGRRCRGTLGRDWRGIARNRGLSDGHEMAARSFKREGYVRGLIHEVDGYELYGMKMDQKRGCTAVKLRGIYKSAAKFLLSFLTRFYL